MWARAGKTAVFPYSPTPEQLREGHVPARLSSGAKLYAPLWWIGPAVPPPNSTRLINEPETIGAALVARRSAAWMEVEPDWEALAAATASRRSSLSAGGRWYLVIDLPPDAAGQDLVIDGRREVTGWIRLAPFDPPRRESGAPSAWTSACVQSARRSPLERWRARLVTGQPLVAPGPASDEFGDRVVESLAEQIESLWSEGLDRLSAADPVLAAEVRARLCLLVDFANIQIPVWPADDVGLARLQADLLSPTLLPQARVQKARDWLSAQPRQAVWIADDATVVDAAAGTPAARVCGLILDPAAGPTAMMVARGGRAQPSEIVSLLPGTVSAATVGLSPAVGDSELRIDVAGWTARRSVVPRALDARPPGLPMTSFFQDWSLPIWLRSACDNGDLRGGASPAGVGQAVTDDAQRTAALLLAQDSVGIGADTPRRWLLYLECRRTPETTSSPKEEVLVHLSGPGGEATLRVFPDGQVVSSRGGSTRVPTEQTEDRWLAWVPLPETVISDGRWIRLGIARTDAQGRRWSWPRAMFPWEDLPPHAAIDLGCWDDAVSRPR